MRQREAFLLLPLHRCLVLGDVRIVRFVLPLVKRQNATHGFLQTLQSRHFRAAPKSRSRCELAPAKLPGSFGQLLRLMDVFHLVLLTTRLPEDGDDDEAGREDDDGADDADEELAQRELERPQPQRLKRQYVRTISVSACNACNVSTSKPSTSVHASSIRHSYQP